MDNSLKYLNMGLNKINKEIDNRDLETMHILKDIGRIIYE